MNFDEKMKFMLYKLGDDGVGDEETGLRDAEAGAGREEVAGRESVGERVGRAVGVEEVRLDAVAGTEAEHHALKDDLIVGQVLETADGGKVTLGRSLDICVQRRIVPEASPVKESMRTWTKTEILAMIPIGTVVAGAMARKGKIRDFIVLIPCCTKF